jgi:predicted transposase YbfD/YdcC
MSVIHRGMEEDFLCLSALLGVNSQKCVSYSQLKRILRSVDYQSFNAINSLYFNSTVQEEDSKWYSLDGKELRGTIAKSSGKKRGMSIVNLTKHQSRQSEIIGHYDATKASEKPVISTYLKEADLTKKKFSFDGLHTSVENLKLIERKQSIYLAQLKGNQKKVLQTCQDLEQSSIAVHKKDQIEEGHGRIEERQYFGYNLEISTLNARWKATGCCTVIAVARGRYNTKTKKESNEKSYWISNQVLDNEGFKELVSAIRNHWSVEVHHHIRDVQMGEDAMKISNKNEAVVVASFLTLATNLVEKQGGSIAVLREKLSKNWKLIPTIFK